MLFREWVVSLKGLQEELREYFLQMRKFPKVQGLYVKSLLGCWWQIWDKIQSETTIIFSFVLSLFLGITLNVSLLFPLPLFPSLSPTDTTYTHCSGRFSWVLSPFFKSARSERFQKLVFATESPGMLIQHLDSWFLPQTLTRASERLLTFYKHLRAFFVSTEVYGNLKRFLWQRRLVSGPGFQIRSQFRL